MCITALLWTIRDLIAATRRLGLTQLWNDALCIVQDDKAEIEHEFNTMGLFYFRPGLVICAAMARDSEDGFLTDSRTVERSYGAVDELPY